MTVRECSRAACRGEAVVTLTYDYADSLIVVGPLGLTHDPHSYDLCAVHAERFVPPNGWQVLRYSPVSDDRTPTGD